MEDYSDTLSDVRIFREDDGNFVYQFNVSSTCLILSVCEFKLLILFTSIEACDGSG